MYLVEWVITLYTTVTPLSLVYKLWDRIICMGEPYIYAIALALLESIQKHGMYMYMYVCMYVCMKW